MSMGGGKGGGDTTTSQMKLPEWYQSAAKKTLGLAQDVASMPYQAYGGQMVAGINPYQQRAFDYTRQNLGQTAGDIRGFMHGMNGLTNYQPEQFTDVNMKQYMNPYTKNVVDTSLSAIDRARQMELQRTAGAAGGAGAFGGSRHGVADSLTTEAALRQSAETSANLYNQGYQQASGLAMQDIANDMQGAQMRMQANVSGGQLANMAGQSGLQSAAALQASGNAMQNQTQQQLANRYQQFLEQRGYPQQQLDIMLRALGGMGLGNAGTTTTTGPAGNPLMMGMGAASMGAGIGSALGGPWGAGIGALGGLGMGLFG